MNSVKDGKYNIEGQVFGRWKVLYRAEDRIRSDGHRESVWHCKCSCGENERDVLQRSLLAGISISCGCTRKKSNVKLKQVNRYDLETYEFGVGFTNAGETFYFDKEDYDKIRDYIWFVSSDGYIVSSTRLDSSKQRLHRLVVGCDDNALRVDHINHNKSDNRKNNLRIVTSSENLMNKRVGSNNQSGYTGVCYSSRKGGCWRAYINKDGKQYHLGYFDNIENAIKVRNDAEDKLFGEYSYRESMKIADNIKIGGINNGIKVQNQRG